jgi:RNA polymerase sigma-70 factor, ECF subfamily
LTNSLSLKDFFKFSTVKQSAGEAEMTELTFIIPDTGLLNAGFGLKEASASNVAAQKRSANAVKAVKVQADAKANLPVATLKAGVVLMSDREIDQQLVERAQSGDKKAFELLVIKYQRKVERLLSRIIRDQAEVEDVAQESFIKAYRALANFRGDSAFYTWLYRISVNTAKNYLISQGRRAPTSTEFDAEEAEGFDDASGLRDIATPDAELMSKQIGAIVNKTIDALPDELKTAITLREIDGMSYEEIAQIMDCPIGTVRSRIFRAREAVALQLRPQLGIMKDRRW